VQRRSRCRGGAGAEEQRRDSPGEPAAAAESSLWPRFWCRSPVDGDAVAEAGAVPQQAVLVPALDPVLGVRERLDEVQPDRGESDADHQSHHDRLLHEQRGPHADAPDGLLVAADIANGLHDELVSPLPDLVTGWQSLWLGSRHGCCDLSRQRPQPPVQLAHVPGWVGEGGRGWERVGGGGDARQGGREAGRHGGREGGREAYLAASESSLAPAFR